MKPAGSAANPLALHGISLSLVNRSNRIIHETKKAYLPDSYDSRKTNLAASLVIPPIGGIGWMLPSHSERYCAAFG